MVEVDRMMPTYGFSDPDPVPNIGRIYPYFKFDGYTATSEEKTWKFIELENDFIQVCITPEIGGKIWGAIEKSTGREFIYFNHVVKFRHVAMRGPWTSGGIETNFGVMGHAPTCSTPVDYLTRENEDGSVSCFIGAIDLPSRTVWRLEINLQPDKSYFTTRAFWTNPTPLEQSYYHWMNAAVKSAGNLEFSYPGTNYIGHDGSLHGWPVYPDGRDLSLYENNDFGRYKSYHVLGEVTGFFGGYWHDDAFGFGRYADYDEKPGKKLWIWGLSRQGMIWEDLLTDSDGQYVEIQSGRLFNQEAPDSIRTPFKHRSFAAGSTDTWTEFWFPVLATEGITQASPKASVNLEAKDGNLHIWVCANAVIRETLSLETQEGPPVNFQLDMAPATVWHQVIPFSGSKDRVAVRIGSDYIIPKGGREGQKMSRPMELKDFDWSTIQGMAIQAKSLEQERNFRQAMETYLQCLEKDPYYLPALVGAARLEYRKTRYGRGLGYIRKALAVDAYHPEANFLHGSIQEALGHVADAVDGYSTATASPGYRSAAYLGLARLYFKKGELARAVANGEKSLAYDPLQFPAEELLLLAHRVSGDTPAFQARLKSVLKGDPLNHFARFEKYRMTGDAGDLLAFRSPITNELPHETYLELALRYYRLGLPGEAERVLELSPAHPVVHYWMAYLEQLRGSGQDQGKVDSLLARANGADANLVFPFRTESLPVLEWAAGVSSSWKPAYYLALIQWSLGLEEEARELFRRLGNEPDFAPFYLAKARLLERDRETVAHCLQKASQLAPNDWRAALSRSRYLLEEGDPAGALQVVEGSFRQSPANYYLGLQYAKTLLLNHRNQDCLDLLENLTVLPNEGATEGYHLYRLSNLNLAKDSLAGREGKSTIDHLNKARLWPENLGVGKPYVTDERMEDFLQGLAYQQAGRRAEAAEYFEKLIRFTPEDEVGLITAGDLLVLVSYLQLDREAEAEKVLSDWRVKYPTNPFVDWVALWLEGRMDDLASRQRDWRGQHSNESIGSEEFYVLWVLDWLRENPELREG